MTPTQKEIAEGLMNGCWLRQATNHTGKKVYKLFSGLSPVLYVHRLDKILESCLKTDHAGRMTISIQQVRKLRKSHTIKQLYLRKRKCNDQV